MYQMSCGNKMEELAKKIKREIQKVEGRVQETRKSAIEIARSAASSPSQSGDGEHSRNSALITEQALKRILELNKEIEGINSNMKNVIVAPGWVEIEFNGRIDNFYLVKNSVYVEGVRFISTEAPLGKSLIGKKRGDVFDFSEGGIKFKVVDFE